MSPDPHHVRGGGLAVEALLGESGSEAEVRWGGVGVVDDRGEGGRECEDMIMGHSAASVRGSAVRREYAVQCW